MKKRQPLLVALAATALFAAGAAYAGPPVAVTFKNVGTSGSPAAVYSIVTSNEASTYANATPKPIASVAAGGSDTYTVQSLLSPDVNFATVRYTIGAKTCVFTTTYVNALGPGGVKIPSWNKSHNASGGAVCTSNITSINYITHAWTVEFTMK